MDDEAYWTRYRAYVRRRASVYAALILTPIVIVVGFAWALLPPAYAPGDPRGDLLWRLAVNAAFDAFFIALLAYSVRWLLADRRGAKKPRRSGDGPTRPRISS